MGFKNPFSKRKKEQKQNNIITVKYSKLDNIGKVKTYEIPDKSEIDNQINEMNNKITQLTDKLNTIPDYFFTRINTNNLQGPYTRTLELQFNPNHATREYVTIGNKEYMHLTFRTYPSSDYQVTLNDLSYHCVNLIKIYLVKLSGGGTTTVGTYDLKLNNYMVYSDYISNPRSSRTVTFTLPDLRNQLLLLFTHPHFKDPDFFNNAKLTIRVDYFSNLGGRYYRNVEGEVIINEHQR